MTRDRRSVGYHWLALSVATLATSGVLAMGVAAARVPILAGHLTNTDLARRVLVVHVDLGILAWFSAIPVALFHFHRLTARQSKETNRAAAFAPWLSSAGALLLLGGLIPGAGEVYIVNYVPLVTHPLFTTGLALFFAGVAVSYLDRGVHRIEATWPPSPPVAGADTRFPQAVTGTFTALGGLINLGALYVLVALAALGAGVMRPPGGLEDESWFAILMWGPGHVLQFANVAFALVAWALLAAWGSGRWIGRSVRWVLLALAIPLPPILGLVAAGPSWQAFQYGFTLLMQWALFPAVLVFLAFVLVPHLRSREATLDPPSRAALWPLSASVALMLIGFLYGALIRDSDLRIPGHYHACIGAVTLAYMALALLLQGEGSDAAGASRSLRLLAVLYGVGQFVFATGLMLAGSYGLGRKIYGVDQHISRTGQGIGLVVMAVGGMLAFAGGAVWAVAALRRMRAPGVK